MLLARPMAALLWSRDLDRSLRPAFVAWFAANFALSAFWGFIGIWALKELGASAALVGVVFFLGAAMSAWTGYVGGYLSDRVGRRVVIVASWSGQAVMTAACTFAAGHLWLGVTFLTLAGNLGAPARSAFRSLVADMVPEDSHETAFAALRIVFNLGMTVGPAAAGAAIALAGWPAMFLGAAALLAAAAVVVLRTVPAGRFSATAGVTRRPFREIRTQRGLLAFAAAALLASFSFVALATVLPIVAVSFYGFPEWQWGLLAAINPLLVVLAQMWLTRRLGRYAQRPKLVLGTLLMGLPFLLLVLDASVTVIVVVIVVSVIGEMIWTPTSQALATRLAPPRLRGAYLGLYGSMTTAAYALGPLLTLNLLDASGPDPVWLLFAVMTVVAAGLGYWSSPVAGQARSAERGQGR